MLVHADQGDLVEENACAFCDIYKEAGQESEVKSLGEPIDQNLDLVRSEHFRVHRIVNGYEHRPRGGSASFEKLLEKLDFTPPDPLQEAHKHQTVADIE